MRTLLFGMISLLTLISFTIQAEPGRPNKPSPMFDKTKSCTLIQAEYQNVKNLSFVIPKNIAWSQCLKFVGHNNQVGVFFQRDELTNFDKFSIDIIPMPYIVHTTDERDNYSTIKVTPANRRRTVINLSDEASASPNQIVAAKFTLPVANVDRRVIFFYESSESGVTLVGAGVTEIKKH